MDDDVDFSTTSDSLSESDEMLRLPPPLFQDDGESEGEESTSESERVSEMTSESPIPARRASGIKTKKHKINQRNDKKQPKKKASPDRRNRNPPKSIGKKKKDRTEESEEEPEISDQDEISGSESEETPQAPKPSNRYKKQDVNVRDSLITYFMDPRKLRRTPIPEVDSVLPSPMSATDSISPEKRTTKQKKSKTKRSTEGRRSSFGEGKRSSNQKASTAGASGKRDPANSSTASLLDGNDVPPERRFSSAALARNSTREAVRSSTASEDGGRSKNKPENPRQSDKPAKDRGSAGRGSLSGAFKRQSQTESAGSEESEGESEGSEEGGGSIGSEVSDPEGSEDSDREAGEGHQRASRGDGEEDGGEGEGDDGGDEEGRGKPSNTRGDEIRERMKEEEKKEKMELIYEFWAMEKTGHPVSKKYDQDSNIDEMRFEYHRLKGEEDLKTKIKLGYGVFSCINSVGEMIYQRFRPLGISLEGWSDEVDQQKQEYEKLFRKIYKNMASRFYVRPGWQLAMLLGSQFVLFVAPKVLNKFKKNDESEPRVQELDEKGQPIPSEAIKKMSELQAQQRFFEQMVQSLKGRELSAGGGIVSAPPEAVVAGASSSNPSQTAPPNELYEDSHQSDDDSEVVEEVITEDEQDEPASKAPVMSLTSAEAPSSDQPKQIITDVDMEAADAVGEVITQIRPLVDLWRVLRQNDDNIGVPNPKYNDDEIIMPENMQGVKDHLEKRGYLHDKDEAKVEKAESITSSSTVEPQEDQQEIKPDPKTSSKRLPTIDLD